MYEHILVPTDGSDRFGRVAREAAGLAELAGATVHALYVIDTRAVDYSPTRDARQEQLQSLRSTGEAATEAVADVAEDVIVERRIREGTPHREILDYADEIDADLIVMGTHGRTGLDRLLLGSVAERVIRLGDRPVLTVDVDGEETVADDEAAIDAAVEALDADGYELADLREDPYREASTWVVPVRTADGGRVNVHVDAATGETRTARIE